MTVGQNKHKVICTNKKPPLSKEHHVIHIMVSGATSMVSKPCLPGTPGSRDPFSHPIVFTIYTYICGASTTYSWPVEAKKKAGIKTTQFCKPILKRTLNRNDKQKPIQYSFIHPIYQELAELIPDIHKLKKIYKYNI